VRPSERFRECLKRRDASPYNHRRAFEHRRLGEVYAHTARLEEAHLAFREAIDLSTRCANWRTVRDTQQGRRQISGASLVAGRAAGHAVAVRTGPEVWHRRGRLAHVFRVLEQERRGYLEVIDEGTARPTGQAVRWNVAHRDGSWHMAVTVLVVDEAGRVALQSAAKPTRTADGTCRPRAPGHRRVRSGCRRARGARGNSGLVLNPQQMRRVNGPYAFRKVGRPDVTADHHDGPRSYVYRTNKTNWERTSVFVVKREEEQGRFVTGPGRALSIRWVALADAAAEARAQPERFARRAEAPGRAGRDFGGGPANDRAVPRPTV